MDLHVSLVRVERVHHGDLNDAAVVSTPERL